METKNITSGYPNASSLQTGQSITACFWFRCGHNGDDKDYAVVKGTVYRTMDCYNRIQVNVQELITGRHPGNMVWIDCDKAKISINN